ncbi:MAG TPA: SEC59/DGK1/VTE5 family protein [Spirochaetia bacterium]|nr:SEC59/DGK1/VTE5 family protein [Spirochaetia bacterium]
MFIDDRISGIRANSTVVAVKRFSQEVQTEFVRKSIHMLIAMVPTIASISRELALCLLGSGILFYTYAEFSRLSGRNLPIISRITVAASRERDSYGFVLGPVTLAIGAMIALMLYPAIIAQIAIYSLAFGDSLSSIVGKMFGRVAIPGSGGKTFAGSTACFFAVFFTTWQVTHNTQVSFITACTGTLLEALPLRDFDNIILPVGTGFMASLLITQFPLS